MSKTVRELKVSELHPPVLVTLRKEGQPKMMTVWAVGVTPAHVFFRFTEEVSFIGMRTGRSREQITDNAGRPMTMFEYTAQT
jgi:hypothetical protein